MTGGFITAMAHLRDLVEGKVAGARFPIPVGRFRPTMGRVMVEDQPEMGAHRRYEILPTSYADGFEDTGPANVTGLNRVDATVECVLRVAYYCGGGGDGDLVNVPDEMAEDAFLLRRCLTFPADYDGATSTIITCTMGETTFAWPHGPPRIALLTMPFVAQITEDWTVP
jgi:hypothetical protein